MPSQASLAFTVLVGTDEGSRPGIHSHEQIFVVVLRTGYISAMQKMSAHGSTAVGVGVEVETGEGSKPGIHWHEQEFVLES
jgi:hypothetical protein